MKRGVKTMKDPEVIMDLNSLLNRYAVFKPEEEGGQPVESRTSTVVPSPKPTVKRKASPKPMPPSLSADLLPVSAPNKENWFDEI